MQVVPHPTRVNPSGNSILKDLVLLSATSQLVSCDMIPPLGNTDHNGIDAALNWFLNPPCVKTPSESFGDTLADFSKTKHLLDAIDWTFFDDGNDIDTLRNK